MKKLPLLLAGFSLLGLLAPGSARAEKALGPKAKLMAKYDLNKNGVIDGEEIAAVRKDFAAEPAGDLKRFDTDKDGKLSDTEIAEIKPPGAKATTGEPKKKGRGHKEKTEATPGTAPAPAPAATMPDAPKEKSS